MFLHRKKMTYGISVLAYGLGFAAAGMGHAYIAGIILMLAAVCLYAVAFQETKNLVDLKGLFSLSWIGGQGIACLQLSRLQRDWSTETWVCFFLAYICFCLGYDWKKIHRSSDAKLQLSTYIEREGGSDIVAKKVFICSVALAAASVICFMIEAAVVGFIPLFSDMPHAYSYFHISGVHYFTISCILIPALTVIYARVSVNHDKKMLLILIICNVIAIAIPILCVSRFQLLFAVAFALVIYLVVYKKITLKAIIMLLVIMIPAYILLTVARRHNVEYLNGIFEMKYAQMPIFITQPYMYVANNFENFNCMVEQLVSHSYGLKMLFPVFALTGLKFIFPQLVSFPIFITKPELTTLTMFYDAYYDFGVLGIVLLAFILGIAGRKLMTAIISNKNPVIYLFYGQIAIYLALSFFTTWFSNPTTWFWLALTTMMYLYVGYEKKRGTKR